MAKKIYFLITVDGDLRIGDIAQQRAAVAATRALHAGLDLLGHTTWFINEIDFCWTECLGDWLLTLVDSGETIGVHDHLDTHYAESYEDILALMRRSRQQLADFLTGAGRPALLLAHRNGCLHQSDAAYRVTQVLGYRWVSDAWPQTLSYGRMVPGGAMPYPWRELGKDEDGILTDNRMLPLNGAPWRHDAHNWLDYSSRSGHFLHVPVTSIPFIEWERMQTAIANGGERVFLVLDTHPYDLQDYATAAVIGRKVANFTADLRRVGEELGAQFIRLDQVEALIERG